MSRVSATQVKEIMETDLEDTVIEAFITAANLTVTELLGTSALSDATLLEIERWMAAHLIASTIDRAVDKENTGPTGVTYSGKTAMGLDSTLYGQTCKLLDTTGTLAAFDLAKGYKQASVYAVTSFV